MGWEVCSEGGDDGCLGKVALLPRDEDPGWKTQFTTKTRKQQIEESEVEYSRRKDFWAYNEPAEVRAKGKFHPVRIGKKIVGGVNAYVTLMRENFGGRFMVMLFSVYFGLKGFVTPFGTGAGLMFYFRNHVGVSATDLQAFTVASMAPWSMKALFGAFADAVPLFGYHKRSYIIIMSAAGGIGCLFLALGTKDPKVATAWFFLINLQISVSDLLTEGKYAELMSLRPKTGGAMVSWVWNWYQVAGLLAILIIGPMVDNGMILEMYWLVMPFAFQVIGPVMFGCFPEVRQPPASRRIQWHLIKAKWNYFVLAVLMGIGSIILTIVSVQYSDNWHVILGVSLGVSVVLCTASLVLLPRMLAKAILYLFFSSALYININSALSYYYLADGDCVVDGPHFSATYFTTVVGVVGSIAGMAGVSIFYAVMNDWHFRPTFWVTICLRCVSGIFDFVIVKRYNRDAGVSDHVMYMMGSNIIGQVAYMMEFMPGVVLISKLCPEDVEATVYALLAGFSNFGAAIAQTIGLAMLEIFKVDFEGAGASGDGCNYGSLPLLIILCNMLIPLLAIPLTFLLVPDMRLTDKTPNFKEKAGSYTAVPDFEDNDPMASLIQQDEVEMEDLGSESDDEEDFDTEI